MAARKRSDEAVNAPVFICPGVKRGLAIHRRISMFHVKLDVKLVEQNLNVVKCQVITLLCHILYN